jgi:hypothetical protein
MQSVTITTKLVSSNPAYGEVYSIQHYVIKFVCNLRQVSGFLRYHPPIKLTVSVFILERVTPSVSLTFIETHKKIFFLSLWQTNRRIEQIYKDFG